jgi:endonuclease/exonuclease/phosphatase family metal-dependent hydrolase
MSLRPASFFYHDSEHGWQKIQWYDNHEKQKHKPVVHPSQFAPTLRIATFNVLFDIFEDIESAICSHLRHPYHFSHVLPSVEADVIALQEVTNLYLSQLVNQQWVKKNYPYVTSYTNRTQFEKKSDRRNFSTVIISRIPIKELYLFQISVGTAYRPIPIAVLQHPLLNEELTVSTVHLKAGRDSDSIRKIQLDHLFQLFGTSTRTLECYDEDKRGAKKQGKGAPKKSERTTWKEFDNVLVMGDFNLQLEHEEKFFPTQVVDVWKHLRPDEIGYTSDAIRNIMVVKQAQLKGKQGGSDRFDRILLLPCNKNCGMDRELVVKPTSIEFFADEPLPNQLEVFPSDHFGVVANLVIHDRS